MNDRNLISEKIKALRKTHALSQINFANKVGLSQAAIAQFEQGCRIPSMASLEQIAIAFEIPIQALISQHSDSNENEWLKQTILGVMSGMTKDDLELLLKLSIRLKKFKEE